MRQKIGIRYKATRNVLANGRWNAIKILRYQLIFPLNKWRRKNVHKIVSAHCQLPVRRSFNFSLIRGAKVKNENAFCQFIAHRNECIKVPMSNSSNDIAIHHWTAGFHVFELFGATAKSVGIRSLFENIRSPWLGLIQWILDVIDKVEYQKGLYLLYFHLNASMGDLWSSGIPRNLPSSFATTFYDYHLDNLTSLTLWLTSRTSGQTFTSLKT